MNEFDKKDELPPKTEEDVIWELETQIGLNPEEAKRALEITRHAFEIVPSTYQEMYYELLGRMKTVRLECAEAKSELARMHGALEANDFDYMESRATFKAWAGGKKISETDAYRIFDGFLEQEGIRPKPHERIVLSPQQSDRLHTYTRGNPIYKRAIRRLFKG